MFIEFLRSPETNVSSSFSWSFSRSFSRSFSGPCFLSFSSLAINNSLLSQYVFLKKFSKCKTHSTSNKMKALKIKFFTTFYSAQIPPNPSISLSWKGYFLDFFLMSYTSTSNKTPKRIITDKNSTTTHLTLEGGMEAFKLATLAV